VELFEPNKLIIRRCSTDQANEVMHHHAVAGLGRYGAMAALSRKSRCATPMLDVIVESIPPAPDHIQWPRASPFVSGGSSRHAPH
jgi:hypothetical protein